MVDLYGGHGQERRAQLQLMLYRFQEIDIVCFLIGDTPAVFQAGLLELFGYEEFIQAVAHFLKVGGSLPVVAGDVVVVFLFQVIGAVEEVSGVLPALLVQRSGLFHAALEEARFAAAAQVAKQEGVLFQLILLQFLPYQEAFHQFGKAAYQQIPVLAEVRLIWHHLPEYFFLV